MPREDLMQPRGGTAAQWESANPVLELREYGFETDTGKHKYGDGSSNWNDLPYAGKSDQIIIAGLPFTLVKNKTIPNNALTLEVGDVIKGFATNGDYMEAKYLGGDETDFNNDSVYLIFNGI